MELKNIQTFLKVTEACGFTKAAVELGYSQAAVTAQIKQLETELGTPLFDRLGRSICLTEAGRNLLPAAYQMQQAAENIVNSVRGRDTIAGEIRIGASSSTSMGKLPGIISSLITRYPDVRISVRSSDFIDDLIHKIKTGEFDFLYLLDEHNHYSDFRIIQESPEAVGFVTYASNPLCTRKKIPLQTVLQAQLVTSDRDSSYSMYLAQRVTRQGISYRPAAEVSSISAIVEILLQGFGVGFIPLFMAEPWIARGELTVLDVEDPGIEIWLQLFCHKDKWLSPAMQAFIDYINSDQTMEEYPGS